MFIKKHKEFLFQVFKYTISAFGGPQSHLALLFKNFTINRNYCSKEEIIELNSLCQILPGATSTQLITLIGYKKGGFKLALLTFLIWVIPACFIMGLLSFLIVNNNNSLNIIKNLKFIQPMAIGFLLFSTYTIFKVSRFYNGKMLANYPKKACSLNSQLINYKDFKFLNLKLTMCSMLHL